MLYLLVRRENGCFVYNLTLLRQSEYLAIFSCNFIITESR